MTTINELIELKEAQLLEIQTYLGVLKDIQARPDSDSYLKVLLDVGGALSANGKGPTDRPVVPPNFSEGSQVANAWNYLNRAGAPAHIDDILIGIGLEKRQSSSLASQLNLYARQGRGFKRVAANTFDVLGE